MAPNIALRRVKKDLATITKEELPGIYVAPQDDDLFKVHALIIGPDETPYQGGFFHFVVRHGPQYPLHPPKVKLMTTGGDTVRFNPNLYKTGKVCLSILGTWEGPAWSPASNLSSVLISVQSLMNEKPYHNEPGFEKERRPGDSDRYNAIIEHETIRIAVIQNLNGTPSVPEELRKVMLQKFMDNYDHYVRVCEKNIFKDQQQMEDPFGPGEGRGKFQFKSLLSRLAVLKNKIDEGLNIFDSPANASSSDTNTAMTSNRADDASNSKANSENANAKT